MAAVPQLVDPAAQRDRPFIIGITGYKRSGKDTAADVIASMLGMERIQFAQPLKEMLRTLLRIQGISEDTIEACIHGDLKEAPAPPLGRKSPRHAMQTLGTEWGRTFLDPEIWVNIALDRAAVSAGGAVITDVRFPNEADAVRLAGGTILRVDRPETAPEPGADLHTSERGIDEIVYDHRIENATDRAAFQESVAGWVWRKFLASTA